MRFPNLFVVGAMKAGTTTLHQVLSAHPEIFMSRVKEPKFFAFQRDKTPFRGPGDPGNQRFFVDRRRYLRLFEGWRSERYAGECSTIYLYREEAAENISENVADARIVIVLREPVERAHSNYLYAVQRGFEPEPSFRNAVSLEEVRIADGWGPLWHYKRKGLYAGQVERYLRNFPPRQVFVGLFDDLRSRPALFYRRLLEFLELDDHPLPIATVANRSYRPQSHLITTFLGMANRLPYVVRRRATRGVLSGCLRRFGGMLRQRNAGEAPRLSRDDAAWLRPHFEGDLARLEDVLGRSLESWRRDDSGD